MRHENSFSTLLGLAIATLWTPFGCGGDDDTAQDTDTSTGESTATTTSAFTSFTSSGSSTSIDQPTSVTSDATTDVATDSTTEGDEGPAWTCDELPQAGQVALIDDFELDYLPASDGRVGAWFAYDDGTGGERNPEPYAHSQEDAHSGESSARIHGQGFTYWGAALGVVLYHNGQGACPYDASTYDGISFWARGLGTVRMHISTVPTTPIEEGGTCTAGCWSNYGTSIELTDTWELYTFTWDQLQRPTWGSPSVFDPAEIIYMHWQFDEEHAYTPFDLWLDDVSFYALDDGGTGTGEGDSDSSTGSTGTEGDGSTGDIGSTGTGGDDSTGSTGIGGDDSTGSTGVIDPTGDASSSTQGEAPESSSGSETGGSESGSSSGVGE